MKKRLSLILLCFIILLGVCGCGNNQNKYESRKEIEIDDNTLQEIEKQIANIENVESIDLSVRGRIIYVGVEYNKNTSSEYKQTNGLKILSLFDKKFIDYYDFSFDTYHCQGHKSYNKDDITWMDCSDD